MRLTKLERIWKRNGLTVTAPDLDSTLNSGKRRDASENSTPDFPHAAPDPDNPVKWPKLPSYFHASHYL